MTAGRAAEQTAVITRSLLHLPIVHSAADLGTLREPARRISMAKWGREVCKRNANRVEQWWTHIEKTVSGLELDYRSVRLYQDGLPICGCELQIVADLARAGSRNHQLLLQLQDKGAVLMGTESPDLLLEEYAMTKEIFSGGDAQQAARKEAHLAQLRTSLLERRDRYIASRINSTLGQHETGILFLGLMHSVTKFLNADIRVVSPL